MKKSIKVDPSVDYLLECFNYNADTGVISWRERPCHHFASEGYQRSWNSKFANTAAGYLAEDGYLEIGIRDKNHKAHRIIWAIYTGSYPEQYIDHLNGVRSDNRICNLRAVDKQENGVNTKIHSNNSSGVSGVMWCKRTKRWEVYIRAEGKKKHLGRYVEFDVAVNVRRQAEITYGYHPNHGKR